MFDPWGYLLRKKAKRAFLGTINYAFRSDQLDLKEMQCISDSPNGFLMYLTDQYHIWVHHLELTGIQCSRLAAMQHNRSDFQGMMNIIGPMRCC